MLLLKTSDSAEFTLF